MILTLLREDDMHPYEMMRLLRERREERLVAIRRGTFYHQINALERDGLIAQVGAEREGNRPERTVYTITDAGNTAAEAWVREHLARADASAEFRIALAEAHNLAAADAAVLLQQRLAAQQRELDEYRTALAVARARPVDRQFLLEPERHLALLEADIAWTSALCADLAAGALPWRQPSPEHLAAKADR